MPTVVLRTDARHEISQDSLDTGYDMNPAYPGHVDAVLPTRSWPPIVASPTRVSWRTNGARVTGGQLHLLRRNYSLWPCLFQLFSGSSLLLVVVEPSWSWQRSCPVSFLYFIARRWKEQAIPVRTHKIWLPTAQTSSPTILPLLMSHVPNIIVKSNCLCPALGLLDTYRILVGRKCLND